MKTPKALSTHRFIPLHFVLFACAVWLLPASLARAVSVTLTVAPDQEIAPLVMPYIDYNVVFSEPVAGLEYADFLVSGTAGVTAGNVTASPSTPTMFRLRLAGFTQAGTIDVTLPAATVAAVAGGAPNTAAAAPTISYAPVTNDDLAAMSDEFDDASTLSNWLRNNTEEGWNADKLEAWDIDETAPGRMHLMPYTSTWYQNYTGVLVYKEVTGDFVVTLNLDSLRRNGAAGRPTSNFSLAGLLIRTDRGVDHAAPNPDPGPGTVLPTGNNIPPEGQPGHYTTDWQSGTENYVFLSYGFGNGGINNVANQWQYEVKTTINSNSNLYPSVREVPAGESNSTLQIVRVGQTFLLLRRHGAGPWIIENRFVRNDMPATVQVGITVYTDYPTASQSDPYHHNRTVQAGVGNPDLVANLDYYRLRRPAPGLTDTALAAVPVTGQHGPVSFLAGTALEDYLGDAPNVAYVDPGETWAQWLARQFTPEELLDPAVSDPQAVRDGVGLPNVVDFLVDGESEEVTPELQPNLVLTMGEGGAPTPQLTLGRNPQARGFRLMVEATSNFSGWDLLAESIDGQIPAGPGFLDEEEGAFPIMTIIDPPQPENPDFSATGRYYRVRGEPVQNMVGL